MNNFEKTLIKSAGGTITALKQYIKTKIDYSDYKTLKIKYIENTPLQNFNFNEFLNKARDEKDKKKEKKRQEKADKQAEYREKLKEEG